MGSADLFWMVPQRNRYSLGIMVDIFRYIYLYNELLYTVFSIYIYV